ncbi:choice-of-anchor L domain-containing protein [Colwellia echini]|uniref:PEP-CTERM sorting domain-containing protein n=1 Tax=Colwellia echini TaxID=1982103 RepID=A0ABY3MTW0_9GAMM|nr:choice-of-anchor L domain-containing protein [Colwellia echini]TYK64640.1 PEP-CTERM sorting domain-containing protein [Colwellia echini]
MNIKNLKNTLTTVILSTTCFINSAHAGLVVTQDNNANTLVSNILGSGVSTSNISLTGANNAFGTFTGGASAGIGIESGIMLSSGLVTSAVGPNSSTGTSTSFGTPGDAQLSSFAGNTFDAATLTFDFVSDGGNIFFNYVFASEEYNEYVNSNFNDAFAFFLDGSNIALIPGTNTPVSINNVNGGNPVGTNASNAQYFNNNNNNLFDIEYDGFTDVFTASFSGLSAGTHSISLKIADTGDNSLDSTVFIQSNSFSDTQLNPIPEPATLAVFAVALFGLRSRKIKK